MPILVILFLSLTLLLSACSSVLPPIQSMSDARQAVKAARDAQVQDYMPASMAYIERRLQRAEEELASGPHAYQFAHFNALLAKEDAVQAHQLTMQLKQAETALQAAEVLGYACIDTQQLLDKAKRQARQGDLQKAMNVAQQAELQAVKTQQQARLQRAKDELQYWHDSADLDAAQQRYLQLARQAIAAEQGEQALEYLRILMDLRD